MYELNRKIFLLLSICNSAYSIKINEVVNLEESTKTNEEARVEESLLEENETLNYSEIIENDVDNKIFKKEENILSDKSTDTESKESNESVLNISEMGEQGSILMEDKTEIIDEIHNNSMFNAFIESPILPEENPVAVIEKSEDIFQQKVEESVILEASPFKKSKFTLELANFTKIKEVENIKIPVTEIKEIKPEEKTEEIKPESEEEIVEVEFEEVTNIFGSNENLDNIRNNISLNESGIENLDGMRNNMSFNVSGIQNDDINNKFSVNETMLDFINSDPDFSKKESIEQKASEEFMAITAEINNSSEEKSDYQIIVAEDVVFEAKTEDKIIEKNKKSDDFIELKEEKNSEEKGESDYQIIIPEEVMVEEKIESPNIIEENIENNKSNEDSLQKNSYDKNTTNESSIEITTIENKNEITYTEFNKSYEAKLENEIVNNILVENVESDEEIEEVKIEEVAEVDEIKNNINDSLNESKMNISTLNISLQNASTIFNRSFFHIDLPKSKFFKEASINGSYGNLETTRFISLLQKQKKPFNKYSQDPFICIQNLLKDDPEIQKNSNYKFNMVKNLENSKKNIIEWMKFFQTPEVLIWNKKKNPIFQVMLEFVDIEENNINLSGFLIDLAKDMKDLFQKNYVKDIKFIFVYENSISNKNFEFTSREFNELMDTLKDLNMCFLLTNVNLKGEFTEDDFEKFFELNTNEPILKLTVNENSPSLLNNITIPYMIFKDTVSNLKKIEKTIYMTSLDLYVLRTNKEKFQDLKLQREVFLLNILKEDKKDNNLNILNNKEYHKEEEENIIYNYLLDLQINLNSEDNHEHLLNEIRKLKNFCNNNILTTVKNCSITGNGYNNISDTKSSSPVYAYYILDEISSYLKITDKLSITNIYDFVKDNSLITSDDSKKIQDLIIDNISTLINGGVTELSIKDTTINGDNILKLLGTLKKNKDKISLEKIIFKNSISDEAYSVIETSVIYNKKGEKINIVNNEDSLKDNGNINYDNQSQRK